MPELMHPRVLSRSSAEGPGFTVPDALNSLEGSETLSFERVR